jgi:outer membrane protein W
MTLNTLKATTIAIQDQEELTRVAIKLAAVGLEALTEETIDRPTRQNANQLVTEEQFKFRFKFTVHVNGRPERAYLDSIALNNDKSATGKANATVLLSPTLANRYHFIVTRTSGTWRVRIDQIVRIDND